MNPETNIETTSDRTINQISAVAGILVGMANDKSDLQVMMNILLSIFDTEIRLIWEPNDDDPNAQHVWDYFKQQIGWNVGYNADSKYVNEILNAIEHALTHSPLKSL